MTVPADIPREFFSITKTSREQRIGLSTVGKNDGTRRITKAEGLAAEAGLKPGMIILFVDGKSPTAERLASLNAGTHSIAVHKSHNRSRAEVAEENGKQGDGKDLRCIGVTLIIVGIVMIIFISIFFGLLVVACGVPLLKPPKRHYSNTTTTNNSTASTASNQTTVTDNTTSIETSMNTSEGPVAYAEQIVEVDIEQGLNMSDEQVSKEENFSTDASKKENDSAGSTKTKIQTDTGVEKKKKKKKNKKRNEQKDETSKTECLNDEESVFQVGEVMKLRYGTKAKPEIKGQHVKLLKALKRTTKEGDVRWKVLFVNGESSDDETPEHVEEEDAKTMIVPQSKMTPI